MAKRARKGKSKVDPLSYKLSNSVTNVSKRCQQPREVVRPLLKEWLQGAQDGLYKCPYCGVTITLATASFDHEIPISRGGDLWGDNLVMCCFACNKAKGSLDGNEYQGLLDTMEGWPETSRLNVLRRLRIGGAMFGRFKRRRRR